MFSNRLRLQLTGLDQDNGDLRFDDFLKQLDATRRALNEVDRILHNGRTVYYRVVDLTHSSPAAIELEAVPIDPNEDHSFEVPSALYAATAQIQERQTAPENLDYQALQAIKEFASLLAGPVTQLVVSQNGDMLQVSRKLPHAIDEILGPDIFEHGEYSGMLHRINLHGGQKALTVYPTWGGPKLKCIFSQTLREAAVQAVDHYVSVYGVMKYKRRDQHPYEMDVTDITVHPDDSELPTLREMHAMAPDATGGRPSEEYIRDIRNEWK